MYMRLSGGFPREPEHGNWDELARLPGLPRFLEALFQELGGVDVSASKCTEIDDGVGVDPADEDVAIHRFRCGTKEVGYFQTERVVLESSDFPVGVTVTTFGLPSLTLSWRYRLTYEGQLGHCGFRHGSLDVRFEDAVTKSRFDALWLAVFGIKPEWEKIGSR